MLATAQAIHQGLYQAGYEVIPLPIASPQELPQALLPYNPGRCIVFNWYEGVEVAAQDAAQVTSWLDELGYTYTGADTLTLRTTQDKLRVKRVLSSHGIPTPRWQSLRGQNAHEWSWFPAIVKVANEHGSEHLTHRSVVYDQESLLCRAAELHALGADHLMVSEFLQGREFTVALWGNGHLETLPLVEVDYGALPATVPHVRTQAAKWELLSADYAAVHLGAPRNLRAEWRERIEEVARETWRALHLRDYGRVDLRMRGDEPNAIDVNCNPDLAADSSFVAAAMLGGYTYSTMLDRIVRLAIHRTQLD